ncbi:HAD family hydrolase [Microvirga brassicacearum]|uniref:HAD family hydrolase n=1 Tax=Microvirga brassicacearum TaxID=2580413 RepID=UPI001390BE86|nr:HAD family hydrolase [Microvirga brassicacearum]
MTEIRAICFDAFGTLVEITDKRRPFQTLLRDEVQGKAATEVLTTALDLRGLVRILAHGSEADRLSQLENDLLAECASVRLRPGIDDIWLALRQTGLKIGVCSNLALPYGPTLLSKLPDPPDAVVLSYQVGLIKPDPAIFWLVCDWLHLRPAQILFVGDTQSSDVDGPRSIGMPAMLISEFENHLTDRTTAFGYLPAELVTAIRDQARR